MAIGAHCSLYSTGVTQNIHFPVSPLSSSSTSFFLFLQPKRQVSSSSLINSVMESVSNDALARAFLIRVW